MLKYFLTLGLDPDASDEMIRSRYLELIKKHTPEKSAEKFQEISSAYEKIKTRRQRIHTKIFGPKVYGETENVLLFLVRSQNPKRRRVGLEELIRELSNKER